MTNPREKGLRELVLSTAVFFVAGLLSVVILSVFTSSAITIRLGLAFVVGLCLGRIWTKAIA